MSEGLSSSKELLRQSGFSFLSPRFRDHDLEVRFLTESFHQMYLQWNKILKVAFPTTAVTCVVHWVFAEEIPRATVLSELGLLLILALGTLFKPQHFRLESRYLLTFLMTTLGQSAGLAVLATGTFTRDVVIIGYLAIMIGGIAPNSFRLQVASTVIPAVALLGLIHFLGMFVGRHFAYHIGFVALTVGLILAVSAHRAAAARMEFLLTLKVDDELKRSNRLLTNVLPEKVARRMKELPSDDGALVERFEDVTVLFADLVGFTSFAAARSPEETVRVLSDLFRRFDAIASQCGIEKIKTIGDAYMAVAGLPERVPDHARRIADAALEMREAVKKFRALTGNDLKVRIGLHSGPVIAGIIGTKKFLYDLWGDTVNTASRLESHGIPDEIQISAQLAETLAPHYELKPRGKIEMRGKGPFEAFILERPRLAQPENPRREAA